MWKGGTRERVKVEKGNDNVKNVDFIHIQIPFDIPKDVRSVLAYQKKSINEN
jgi:hypothetical protein